jgi:hypothetical protein
MGLSFTIAAGPRQRSHSQVRVPEDSQPHFAVSDSRLSQPGGPGPSIYIPHEQGGTVIPPPSATGFPFRRLLRLAGLRWRYSIPAPRGIHILDRLKTPYIALAGPSTKHRFQQFLHCLGNVFISLLPHTGSGIIMCLPSRCLATDASFSHPVSMISRVDMLAQAVQRLELETLL